MSIVERERVQTEVVTTRDVLHRAADLLSEFGWCQGREGSLDEGEICAMGAVNEAARSLGVPFRRDDALDLALDRIAPYVPEWNDAPGRTKEEVVAALRHTAESL